MLMQDTAEKECRLLFGVMKIGETLQSTVDGIGVKRCQDAVPRQGGINDEFQLFRGTYFPEPTTLTLCRTRMRIHGSASRSRVALN